MPPSSSMIVQITPLTGPLAGQAFAAKVDQLQLWGGNDPFPTPPIAFPPGWVGGVPPGGWPPEQLPPPKADWQFNGDGWFFVWGPFDKPHQLGDNSNLDITKSGWKTMGQGWYFVSGPYDKPLPIFGSEVPPDIDPPPTPVPDPGCKWHYTGLGWVLICGPYDKPRPQPGTGQNQG